MRGKKKQQKVNDHISTSNEPIFEIFFLRYTQYYHNFFWHIFGVQLDPQMNIFRILRAGGVSKMPKNVPLTSKIEIQPRERMGSFFWYTISGQATQYLSREKKILALTPLEKKLRAFKKMSHNPKNRFFWKKNYFWGVTKWPLNILKIHTKCPIRPLDHLEWLIKSYMEYGSM